MKRPKELRVSFACPVGHEFSSILVLEDWWSCPRNQCGKYRRLLLSHKIQQTLLEALKKIFNIYQLEPDPSKKCNTPSTHTNTTLKLMLSTHFLEQAAYCFILLQLQFSASFPFHSLQLKPSPSPTPVAASASTTLTSISHSGSSGLTAATWRGRQRREYMQTLEGNAEINFQRANGTQGRKGKELSRLKST